MEIKCSCCNKILEVTKVGQSPSNRIWMYTDSIGRTMRGKVCADCNLERQKNRRTKEANASTKIYEKTPKGFLMRLYRNMKSRIDGVQKKNHHLYDGKSLLPKEEFYNWANNNPEFLRLFKDYEKSGFERKLAPSVDRIDSSKGYELSNMEFVTMSENSRRGSIESNKRFKR